MSLDYYLICRSSYDKILDHIESIIYAFEDMNDSDEDWAAYMADDGLPDADPGICEACSGSGEGQYDGSVCPVCKGMGEWTKQYGTIC